MSWKEDRDALIAQTMAFVQSVTNRRQGSGPDTPELAVLPAGEAPYPKTAPKPPTPLAPIKGAEYPPVVSAPAPRPIGPGDMASEIRARIAGFRAHQERFNREREEYFSKTLARLKATLDEMPPPRSD
ncbi:MAG TPA: hypothetical protein VFW87_21810 [Pirellulales bacterium]|nr:hypothetical protein [Pirellulales bacterium]